MVSGNVAPAIFKRTGDANAVVGARARPAARSDLSFIKISNFLKILLYKS
jgi:hypothetical protein